MLAVYIKKSLLCCEASHALCMFLCLSGRMADLRRPGAVTYEILVNQENDHQIPFPFLSFPAFSVRSARSLGQQQ